jgi:hypothetical protein
MGIKHLREMPIVTLELGLTPRVQIALGVLFFAREIAACTQSVRGVALASARIVPANSSVSKK